VAEVVILGAGLTGLSVAYHLESHNYLDYKIFEQHARPGGLLKTESTNGFNFDYTGHYLHVSDNYFRQFLNDIADLDTNFDLIERKSSVFLFDKYLNYPIQKNLYGLPADVIYECIDGFIKRKTSIKKPQNFYDWVLKYFGTGMGKYFFYPYNSKLLNYDVKKIVPSWTGRFVPQTDLKSILHGALENIQETGIGYNHSFYYPKIGGIEFLIKKMLCKLKNKIETNHKVISVDLANKSVVFENGHTEKYKTLVTTIPLKDFLKCTKNYARQAENLKCASVINFNLGFKQSSLGHGHWVYFPENKFPFYRIGFWHNISKSIAAPGKTGIYGETSFLHGTKTQKQIENLTKKSIHSALNFLKLSRTDIIASKMLNIDHAYVIYDAWREKNLKKLLDELADQSIHSVGRFGEWNYSSMQEAVLGGKATAEKILEKAKERWSNGTTKKPLSKQKGSCNGRGGFYWVAHSRKTRVSGGPSNNS